MANDFSADTNCAALWRLESGALTADSKGGNTLTDINTVGVDTSNHREGSACADFELDSAECLNISDASLDSGFPLKSGDTNKVISVCAWFRGESFAAAGRTLVSKYDHGADKRVFHVSVRQYSTGVYRVQAQLGYNGGASGEVLWHGSDLSTGTWYHVTFSYDNADKSWALRLRNTSGGVVGTDATGTATLDANKLNVEDAPFTIGAMWNSGSVDSAQVWDGLVDEVVVFKDVITAAEATKIAQGSYGPVSYSLTMAGGGLAGGAATTAFQKTRSVAMAGGALAGGAAALAFQKTFALAMAGGALAGGGALITPQRSYGLVMSGGGVAGGVGGLSRSVVLVPAAGGVSGGAAARRVSAVRSMAGGGVLGGAAGVAFQKIYSVAMQGGALAGGAAVVMPVRALVLTMQGGAVAGGAAGAAFQKTAAVFMAGGGIGGGAAAVVFDGLRSLAVAMSGGAVAGGAAEIVLPPVKPALPDGGFGGPAPAWVDEDDDEVLLIAQAFIAGALGGYLREVA